MKLENLQDLYIHELQDLYSAESQILEALPKMVEASADESVKHAFKEHMDTTRKQQLRLESIFEKLNVKPDKVKCEGIKGIIKEGETLIKKDKSFFRFGSEIDNDVLDAALIANAQRVEHYEISGYGTVLTYANRLGFSDHAALLKETLDEESETDRKLTQLAESGINIKAQA